MPTKESAYSQKQTLRGVTFNGQIASFYDTIMLAGVDGEMRGARYLMSERIWFAVLFLLIGALGSVAYFFVRDYDLNWVEISVNDFPKVEDVTVAVGLDRLIIGTLYAGSKYRYAFRSPGEGGVSFEGKIGHKSFECKGIGYITPHAGSHTLIDISEEFGVRVFHRGDLGPMRDQAWACSSSP